MTGTPLDTALWEADRHLRALDSALQAWLAAPARTLEALESDPTKVRIVDQLLYRFTKLQDALGARLVPATLARLAEPCEDWSMIDRLNRLEKLGLLQVEAWLRWREIRNRLAHEYPEAADARLETILAAISAAAEMAGAYRHWRDRLEELTRRDTSG